MELDKYSFLKIINNVVYTIDLHITIVSTKSKKVQVYVYNSSGILMSEKELKLEIGEQLIEYDISQLPKGMYYLSIIDMHQIVTKKFYKVQ